jgi:hypothetical protein
LIFLLVFTFNLFFQPEVFGVIFRRCLSLSSLKEAMVPPSLRSTPDRNSSKQNTTRKRYTDLGDSGGVK